jgi:hypothetical protein
VQSLGACMMQCCKEVPRGGSKPGSSPAPRNHACVSWRPPPRSSLESPRIVRTRVPHRVRLFMPAHTHCTGRAIATHPQCGCAHGPASGSLVWSGSCTRCTRRASPRCGCAHGDASSLLQYSDSCTCCTRRASPRCGCAHGPASGSLGWSDSCIRCTQRASPRCGCAHGPARRPRLAHQLGHFWPGLGLSAPLQLQGKENHAPRSSTHVRPPQERRLQPIQTRSGQMSNTG